MAYQLLFPFPKLMVLGDNQQHTAHLRQGQNGMRTCGIFLNPDRPDIMHASPDRILEGHPDRDTVVGLEIKDKDMMLAGRPEPEHLVQLHAQMVALKSSYIFI